MVSSERYFNETSLSSRLCERYRRFWYHHCLLQICWFLLISPSSWRSKKRLLEPLSSVIILGPFSTAGQIDNFFFCTIHWNKRNHDSRYWVGNEILSISRGGGGRSAIWIWQVHSLWLEIAEFDLVWVGQDGKAAFLPLNWYCLGLFVKKNPHNDCHLRLCSYHTGWHFVMWTLIHDLCDST